MLSTSRIEIASFWRLLHSKIEELSQNSCVDKLAGRQANRQMNR